MAALTGLETPTRNGKGRYQIRALRITVNSVTIRDCVKTIKQQALNG